MLRCIPALIRAFCSCLSHSHCHIEALLQHINAAAVPTTAGGTSWSRRIQALSTAIARAALVHEADDTSAAMAALSAVKRPVPIEAAVQVVQAACSMPGSSPRSHVLFVGHARADQLAEFPGDGLQQPAQAILHACLESSSDTTGKGSARCSRASGGQLARRASGIQFKLKQAATVHNANATAGHAAAMQLLQRAADVGLLDVSGQGHVHVAVPGAVASALFDGGYTGRGTAELASAGCAAALRHAANTLAAAAALHPLAALSAAAAVTQASATLAVLLHVAAGTPKGTSATAAVVQAVWQGFSVLQTLLWPDDLERLLQSALMMVQAASDETMLCKVCSLCVWHCHSSS